MCEQLGNLIECFEVDYPPFFFFFFHSLSWWTLILPALNKDKLFDAYMPSWKFIATRQIKRTMQSAHFLYGLVVSSDAGLLRCSCINVPDKKESTELFAFHLSYKFEFSEPEGWKQSRKQWSIIRTQFLLLWHGVPWSARAAGKTRGGGWWGKSKRQGEGERKEGLAL